MRPCLCILVMLSAIILGGAQGISGLLAADLGGAENQEPQDVPEAPEGLPPANAEENAPPTNVQDAAPKRLENERGGGDERRIRKGIGADFWGGPYWGYGPRWGHPCESCRATCEADEDSSRCERCRVRCGW